jgi:hypothetical protein
MQSIATDKYGDSKLKLDWRNVGSAGGSHDINESATFQVFKSNNALNLLKMLSNKGTDYATI